MSDFHLPPLNQQLYDALSRRFGRVSIASSGIEALPVPGHRHGRACVDYKHGEYMRVNCPWCGDTTKRLYFSYLWGVWDPEERTKHLDLAICYNEDCLAKAGRKDQLYYELYGAMPGQLSTRETLRTGTPYRVPDVVSPPGSVVPIDRLPFDHPAVSYLLSRNCNIPELAAQFQIGYCEEAADDYPMMQHRIVIPVYHKGKMVGWQGRYPDDLDWKARRIPKYYNWVHFSKSQYVYNYDSASQYKVVVIVEGVADVWSGGPQFGAIFGASASAAQLSLLGELGREGRLVLMLDGNEAGRKGMSQEKLAQLEVYLPGRVVPIWLPEGVDPGQTLRPVLWSWIEYAVRASGWTEPMDARRPIKFAGLPARRHVIQRIVAT